MSVGLILKQLKQIKIHQYNCYSVAFYYIYSSKESNKMNIRFTYLTIILLSLSLFSKASSGNDMLSSPVNKAKGFIENKGQIIDQNNLPNRDVAYIWNGPGLNVQLRKTGFSYDVFKTVSTSKNQLEIDNTLSNNKTQNELSYYVHRIDFEFENANDHIITVSENPFSDPINYFTTATSSNDYATVNHFANVIYKNVWNGIDVEFMLINNKPKYNFIVHENAKLSDIKLKIIGADKITENNGELIIKNSINDITESVPYSFYSFRGNKQNIKISFKQNANNIYTLATEEVIPSGSILTIDPIPDIIWSTYYGGTSDEVPYSICADGSGNMTTTGITTSSGNIATSGANQTSYAGNTDIFIAKFNTSGQIIWSTYYGSTGDDEAFGITSDGGNNNIIIGFTNSTSGLSTSGALYQGAYGGGASDAIMAKFNSSGVIQWASYFGGTNSDYGYAIVSDTNNNIIISGFTSSTTTIATSGSYQTTNAGAQDGFIAKFTPAGAKSWGTYYGGNQQDNFKAICVDSLCNIYVAGVTYSSSGIATSGTYKTNISSGGDGFIVKLNSAGQRQWATYYGGSGTDFVWGIKCDKLGNIIFCGNTNSASGISTAGANQINYGGGYDAFLAKLTPSCSLYWGTYYGGSQQDAATAITLDNTNNIYITGNTSSSSGISNSLSNQFYFGGGSDDGFIAKFDTSGVNLFSSYYGGNLTDLGKGIAFDGISNIVITGQTNSTSGIATSGTYQTSLSGSYDAFLTKFSICPSVSAITLSSNSPVCSGADLILTSSNATSFNWTGPNGFISSLQSPTIISATAINSGSYTLVAGLAGCFVSKQITPLILTVSKPVAGFSQNFLSTCLSGNSFVFNDTSQVSLGTLTRLWSFNNGDTSTSSNFSKSFDTVGTYIVKLYVTSGGNCKDSISKTITVLPSTSIGFTIDDTLQCLTGNTFRLRDTSSYSAGTYTNKWKLGDGQIVLSKPQLTKIYTTPNNYVIKLITTNSNGCIDSVQKNVYVNASPKVGYTQNSFAQCWAGNRFTLVDTSTISTGILTRVWKWSNGDSSDFLNYQKSFSAAGIYTLKLIETSNLNCSDSVTKTFTVYPQNTTGFVTNSSNQCFSGNHYLFTDTSTSTGYTRLWDLGDGTTSDSAIVNKSYVSVGTYVIKLHTITTSSGCIDSAQQIISVNPFVQPIVGFSQNTFAHCLTGNSFTLHDSSSIPSGTISRIWKFSDGDTSTANDISKSFNNPGTFTIKLVQISNNNCNDSISKTVTVYPQTTIGFSNNNLSQCFYGNNFLITDTSSISSGTYSRLWRLGDATTSTSATLNKSYLSDGSYNLKLITTSNNGCIDSIQKPITVKAQPRSGYTQNTFAHCLTGNVFSLQDTSTVTSGLFQVNWLFGDGDTSSLSSFNKTFLTAGTFTSKLITTSTSGCKDSAIKTFTVYPQTAIGFNTNNLSQCFYGNNFLLTDTSTISSGSYTRLWTLGDGTNSTSTSLNKSYLSDGTYNIKLLATSNNGCIDSIQKTIIVKAQPRSGFTQNTFAHCLTGNVFSVQDTSTVTSGLFQVNWLFSDGDTSTLSSFNKTFLTAGTFTSKLVATSTSGCKDSTIKTFIVYPQTAIGFSINNANQCYSGNNFILIDTSSVSGGSFNRLWNLGDNTSSTSIVINKSYSNDSIYLIKLATITNNGCTDSIQKNVSVFAQPKAGFTENSFAQCLNGNSFTFFDTSSISSGSLLHLWSYSDGDTSTSLVANKSFPSSGTYTIKLIEASDHNCLDSTVKNVQIYPQTNNGFNVNKISQCLNSNNFIFTDTSNISSGSYTRIWDLGDGSLNSTSSTNKTYSSVGTYPIGLKTITNYGCIDSAKLNIVVNAQPQSGYNQNNFAQCLTGNRFTLNDTSGGITANSSRIWKFGDGDTSSLNVVSKTFINAGTFAIKLIVTSTNGCSDSSQKTFTVYPQTAIGFYENNLRQCITNNNFILFDTSSVSSGSYSRLWSLGDGATSSNSFISKSYQNEGVYQLRLNTITNNGCIDSIQKTLQVNAQPIVGFTVNNATQCQSGNLFILNDTSSISSGTINKNWSFSNGDTSTLSIINKTFLSPGVYTSKLVVISNNFCRDSVTKSLTIYPKTSIGFSINTNQNQCLSGNGYIFQDTSYSLAGSFSRNWNFGDSTFASSSYVSKKYTVAASYPVILKTTTSNGCVDSIQKNITVFPQPVAGFDQNNFAQCFKGNNFNLFDTSTISNGTTSRIWNFSDGDTSTIDSVIKTFINDGNYQAKLIITSNNNCQDSISKTFLVYPQPEVGFTQNNLSQCFGNDFVFNDTTKINSGSMIRYWSLGDSTFDNVATINKRYNASGTYVVTLYALSQHYCSDMVSKTVTVNFKPQAGFTENSLSQCVSSNSFALNDTSSIPQGTLTRIWNFGDSTTSTQKSLNKSFVNSGLYQIKLISISDSNCTDTLIKSFNVYAKPSAGFTVNNSIQCFNTNNFVFTDTTKNIAIGYKMFWNFGDSTIDSISPIHKSYSDIGFYNIALKVFDNNNCSDSVNKTVSVLVSPEKPIVSTLSRTLLESTKAGKYSWILNNMIYEDSGTQQLNIKLNGSYRVKITNSYGCSNTSDSVEITNVEYNAKNGNIYVYPNPASDKFYIDFNGMQGNKDIQLYNLSGQLVGEFSSSDLTFSIELESYTKGMYMLKINSNAGLFIKKILIY